MKPCNQVVADEEALNHGRVQAMLSIAVASVSAKKILEDLSNRKEFQMRNIKKKNEGLVKQAFGLDCGEVYSPPRITKMAIEMGLHPAWALDLTVMDAEDGMPWDPAWQQSRSAQSNCWTETSPRC